MHSNLRPPSDSRPAITPASPPLHPTVPLPVGAVLCHFSSAAALASAARASNPLERARCTIIAAASIIAKVPRAIGIRCFVMLYAVSQRHPQRKQGHKRRQSTAHRAQPRPRTACTAHGRSGARVRRAYPRAVRPSCAMHGAGIGQHPRVAPGEQLARSADVEWNRSSLWQPKQPQQQQPRAAGAATSGVRSRGRGSAEVTGDRLDPPAPKLEGGGGCAGDEGPADARVPRALAPVRLRQGIAGSWSGGKTNESVASMRQNECAASMRRTSFWHQ